jgi:group I intron endonuclease
MNTGVIYCITSPSNKKYIGQVVNYISNGSPKGIKRRWLQHIRSAKSKNPNKGCRLLNKAILKYGSDNFILTTLISSEIEYLNFYEELCIKIYNTLVPNGYNLQSGGTTKSRHSNETKKRRSESLTKLLSNPEKRKVWSDAKKGKPHKQRNRKRVEDNNLPKYILHYKHGKYEGYAVDSHPNIKGKKFTNSKLSMSEKLQLAISYINSKTI